MLWLAKEQRRKADQSWEALVETLLTEFSKQADCIAEMKRDGQIDSPIAQRLLVKLSEGDHAQIGADVALTTADEIER